MGITSKEKHLKHEGGSTRVADAFGATSGILSILIFFSGCAVLAGWALDIPMLKSVLPGFVTMKANTALAFLCAGLSLWALQEKRRGSPPFQRAGLIVGLIVFVLGFLTCFEYLSGRDLGIDQALFKELPGALLTSRPGRMAFNTAINFTFIGLALCWVSAKPKSGGFFQQVLMLPVGALSLLALIGYTYRADPLIWGLSFSTAMALNTMILFQAVFFGMFFCCPDQGFMSLVSSDTLGGKIMRRLLPFAVLLPLGLGWMKLYFERQGLVSNPLGVSFVAVLNLAFMTSYITALSFWIRREEDERAQAEGLLSESRQRLEFALRGGKLGAWDWNLQTDEVVYSDVWAQMLEYRPDEVEPHVDFFKKHIHPEDLPAVLVRLKGHVEGNMPVYESEHRLRTKSGRWLWIYDRGEIVEKDKDGRPVRATGIISDITERKRVEDVLRDERRRMESIIEGTHVGTWEWNVQTGEAVFNETWAQIIGYTLAELAPISIKAWEIFVHPDDLKGSAELLERHFAGELPYYDYECRMRHKDGHWVWVHDRGRVVTRTDDNKPLMMYGTHADITERKQAEEMMRQSEERFKGLFVEAPLGIALIDSLTGQLYAVNPMYAKITGRTVEEMEHIDWMRITHPEDVQEDLDNMALMNAGKTNGFQMEKRYLRPDGTIVWVHMTIAPIFVEDRAHPRHLCMVEDITEWRRTVEEKETLQKQLAQAQKMEAIGQMASGIAHNFNNILASIRGCTEMALADVAPTGRTRQDLSWAIEGIDSAKLLIEQMMAFGRTSEYETAAMDLRPIVENTLVMFKASVRGAVQIRENLEVPCGWVRANPNELKNVLLNILTNSYQAIDPVRGVIDVSLSQIEINAGEEGQYAGFEKGKHVRLSIRDTGCGMDKKTLARIFEPFFTTKEIGKGTGLGLPVVYGVITRYGGKITVESEPGKGTTFNIFLPQVDTHE